MSNDQQSTQEKIAAIQSALQEEGIDGWLFYNFRGSNVFAGDRRRRGSDSG